MLEGYINARLLEVATIDSARRDRLEDIAADIRRRVEGDEDVHLTFICTHNSRRSHMGQIWAWVAAARSGLRGITMGSGGTEATAFNPRAVASMRRAGLTIEALDDGENPVYRVCAGTAESLECWSKVYGDAANPREGFIAIMTCSSADEACPVVSGASARFTVTYEDPKAFDGTEREAAAYDDRSAQICREMLFLFSRVAALVK